MAAIANITVFDGAATPVSHLLLAVSVVSQPNGSVEATYREALANTPAYANIEARLKMEPLKSGVVRCSYSTAVPIMESIAGQNAQGYTAAPKVALIDRNSTVALNSPRSTVTGRRLARQLHVNLGNNVSTSVAAATSGPVPDLFDSWVAPT